MATVTVATAASAVAFLYYTINRKRRSNVSRSTADHKKNVGSMCNDRVLHKPIQAPATWLESVWTLCEAMRFVYSETLGKWPIGELAFGINFLLRRQGNLQVASVFGGKDSVQLKGSTLAAELKYLLDLLILCRHFSKKSFDLFLAETGFSKENVLLQKPKAGILKPAFTILVDHSRQRLLLLIRGTHSIKDTLTAVSAAVVPFHHTVVHEGGDSELVLGYAHCGMVAAAQWIAKLAVPCLIEALCQFPNYNFKIVGHSLGGGTAALLTYILREQKELSRATCVAFAPAACMTWDLAESGTDFMTSVVNGADIFPTFSAASIDGLRAEVTASAWINDLRNQIKHTRILRTVYRSASALSSRLPSIANAKAKIADAGTLLRPVSSSTALQCSLVHWDKIAQLAEIPLQVVIRKAQSMAKAAWTGPALHVSAWSSIVTRPQAANSCSRNSPKASPASLKYPEDLLTSPDQTRATSTYESVSTYSAMEETLAFDKVVPCTDEEPYLECNSVLKEHYMNEDCMTEVELWEQREHELHTRIETEVPALEREIKEEAVGIEESSRVENKEPHRYFPPGKIMHIVTLKSDNMHEANSHSCSEPNTSKSTEAKIGIFLTPRSLYSKIRLSKTMISDHLMPVYRMQIEKLIMELEKEEHPDDVNCRMPT